MKTRPILFSGEMVRAILDGRKTQTRRIITPQPGRWSGFLEKQALGYTSLKNARFFYADHTEVVCQQGTIGDRLWLRETWAVSPLLNKTKPSALATDLPVWYRATYDNSSHFSWRPSIHMPRWASRITLEVTDVRVERVQDITAEDIIAEGIEDIWQQGSNICLRRRWIKLWDSINAKRGFGWDVNPWVWCVTFSPR